MSLPPIFSDQSKAAPEFDWLPLQRRDVEQPDRFSQRVRQASILELEKITATRLVQREFRPVGIPFLQYSITERMKADSALWPRVPAVEGQRRRIQECADRRLWTETPFLHLRDKYPDNDPQSTRGAYSLSMRLTSCYLLNPRWYLLQERYDSYEIASDFALAATHSLNLEGVMVKVD